MTFKDSLWIFLRTFSELSQDFLRNFLRLYQGSQNNFSGLSPRTFHGLTRFFLINFSRLSQEKKNNSIAKLQISMWPPSSTKHNLDETLFRTFWGLSQDFLKLSQEFLRPFLGHAWEFLQTFRVWHCLPWPFSIFILKSESLLNLRGFRMNAKGRPNESKAKPSCVTLASPSV